MKKQTSMAGLVIVLFVICVITAFLLGLVNDVTWERIEELTAEKTRLAMSEVLEADSYDEVEYTGGDSQVTGVYKAGDAGYVVQVSVSGSQGMIDMVVGVDASGACTGVSIVDMSETPGLGDKAADESFRAQFIGTAGDAAVTKDGGTINALTGATVTSRAVANGVNVAVAAAASIG